MMEGDMRFEWDRRKAESNLSKHEVDFDEARSVFEDPLFVAFEDPDHSIGEQRFLLLGRSSRDRILVVAYTEREEAIRLISARKATRKERHAYEEDF